MPARLTHDRRRVLLDVNLSPEDVRLDEAVADAFAMYDAAASVLDAAVADLDAVDDAEADERAAVAEAARSGKTPPRTNGSDYWSDRRKALDAAVRRASSAALRAALDFERAACGSDVIRAALAARLPEETAAAVEAVRAARAAEGRPRLTAATIRALDHGRAFHSASTQAEGTRKGMDVGLSFDGLHAADPGRDRRAVADAFGLLEASASGFPAEGYARPAADAVAEREALKAALRRILGQVTEGRVLWPHVDTLLSGGGSVAMTDRTRQVWTAALNRARAEVSGG